MNVPATTEKPNVPAIKSDPRQKALKHVFESEGFKATLAKALPKHIPADKMIRLALGECSRNSKLLDCSVESVLLSLLTAAAYGLECNGPLGQGYLVPYWNGKAKKTECKFIPGFRGLCKLARNSGEVADIWAEVVYESDDFTYTLGLEQNLIHTRNDSAEDPGELKYAYAVARFRDGEKRFTVMNRREIEAVKNASASKNRQGDLVGPWKDWEPEMWKKSAVRRLAKMLPLSAEDQQRFAHEDNPAAMEVTTLELPKIAEQQEAPTVVIESQDSPEEEESEQPELQDSPELAKLREELKEATTAAAVKKISAAWMKKTGLEIEIFEAGVELIEKQTGGLS